MPMIIAHEETCDIIVNGPTFDNRIRKQYVVVMPTVCTCGGVRYRVGSSTEGGAHLYRIKPAEVQE